MTQGKRDTKFPHGNASSAFQKGKSQVPGVGEGRVGKRAGKGGYRTHVKKERKRSHGTRQ